MQRLMIEYVLKGIYLGLLLFVASAAKNWHDFLRTFVVTLIGFTVFLAMAAWLNVRHGYRLKGRLVAFFLFLALESPGLIYAGILSGIGYAAFLFSAKGQQQELLTAVAGGSGLGVAFWLLRQVSNRWARMGLGFCLGVALVAGGMYLINERPHLVEDALLRNIFCTHLLLGIPLFYVLTFSGHAEESEVEIAALCAALGLGLWPLSREVFNYPFISFLVPLVVYFVYTSRILPGLRVFKYVIRGIGFGNASLYRPALRAFRRALELDPNNALARENMWSLHRAMDVKQISQEEETLALVDADLCIDRAKSLLLQNNPTHEKLEEAHHLLELVRSQKPEFESALRYWRAVALTHERKIEEASAELLAILDPDKSSRELESIRQSVLFSAWQLAILLHPELRRRVGDPQLQLPGRRMEAISATERQIAIDGANSPAWELKRVLYSELTEAGFQESLQASKKPDGSSPPADGPPPDFDYDYTQQMGLALIQDPVRWERGVEFLKIAAQGLIRIAPNLYQHVVHAYEKAGRTEKAEEAREQLKNAGLAFGVKKLDEENRQLFFSTVKDLAELARTRNNVERAIQNYQIYSEFERSGLETLRILAELYEARGDVFGAILATEKGLVYNGKDKDFLEKKDRYYYSIAAADLKSRLDKAAGMIDVNYCLQKAKFVLDLKDADLDLIDWAEHLTQLALVVKPDSLMGKILKARALRRRGETEAARAVLEEVYAPKPEKFVDSSDEEAWFLACRMLGEAYLYETGHPDLAIQCFNEFRKSSRSGADTMYKLGQAYEQLGDKVRAAKCYEHVTAFESHPLTPEARDALYRLKSP